MQRIAYFLFSLLLLAHTGAHAQSVICAEESIVLSTSAEAALYQWQVQEASAWENVIDGGSYTGAASNALSIAPVLTTMDGYSYRCLIPGIVSEATDSVVYQTALTVLDTLEASVIAFETAPTGPLCWGNNQVTINQTSAPQGGNSTFLVVWEEFNGSTWEEVAGADPAMLEVADLTESRTYRQRIESAGVCGPVYSNELLVEVYDPLNAPEVEISEMDDAICFNTSPGALNIASPASGASGTYSYQWQRFNGATWENVPGETDMSFTPGVLTTSQQYRLLLTDNTCGGIASNVLDIEVFAPLSPSMVIASDASTPLCDANTGTTIQLEAAPTGGGNGFTYQWFAAGEAIAGETATTLATGFLENESDFDLVATSNEGCGTVASNTVLVEVYTPLASGVTTADQTICYDTAPTALNNNGATGASGAYTYQWQQNEGASWNNIDAANGTTYAPGTLTTTTSYRLVSSDGAGCGTSTSNAITVEVLPALTPASVSVDTPTLCYGNSFTVSTSGASGADGDLSNLWYIQLNEGGFIATPSLSELVWTVDPATDDYDVYLESTSNFGCGTVVSNTLHIEVLDPITPPSIDTPSWDGVDLCYADTAPECVMSQAATGADNAWSYAWQQAGMDNDWQNVQFTPNNYNAGTLTDSVQVRIIGTSDFGCGSFVSNTILVPVWNEVQTGVAGPGSEQIICYDTAALPLVGQPATGGGDTFDLQWFAVNDQTTTPVDGANGAIFNTGPLTETTSYYLQYTNTNGCGTVSSNTIQITVLPDLEASTIEGWDGNPLCYNDPVNVLGGGIIDYAWLDHQWFAAGEDGTFEALTDYDEIELDGLALQETTAFYLQTTSTYGCGTVWSDTLTVDVLDLLIQPSIDFAELYDGATLCFNTLSPAFTASTFATGGGGPLSYEWELDTGTTGVFVSTGNNDANVFEPGALTDTVAVRLRVTDLYGCGTLVSNVLDVNVYAPLAFAVQPETQLVCFGDAPSGFSATATGGGNAYSYQWYSSEDQLEFTALDGQVGNTLETLTLETTTLFYLELVSELGCGVINSDTVGIEVLEALMPGQLSFMTSPICAEEPAQLSSSGPAGGFDDFQYTWYQFSDTWEQVQSGGTAYTSDILFFDAQFYASYEDECGTVYSDTITLTVNPLPTINPITGEQAPCYNSVNQLYQIPWADPTLEYAWSMDEDFGTITSGETVDEILVDWSDQTGTTSLEVLVTNPATSCNDLFSLEIEVLALMAPPASEVVKKPGINILVSADSTDCALYQWGTENIETGAIAYLDGYTEQYAFIEELDTLSFYYFVEVVYDCGEGPSCPTINYYNYTPFVGVQELQSTEFLVYPNPSSGHIVCRGSGIRSLDVTSLSGKVIVSLPTDPWRNEHQLNLPIMETGIYLLRAYTERGNVMITRIAIR